jgi:hypothetical protein
MTKRKNIVPYCYLSRRKQRDSFIRLRQKIRSETPVYGGLYTSRHVLEEPGRPALYNQWADVYFLGSDGLTIWNAAVITTVREFWDTVEEMTHSRAWEMLTPEEQSAEAEMRFVPIWSKGKRMYQLMEKPNIVYEKFGGLTYTDYQEKLAEEIIKNKPPEVFESFKADRSYRYGVGLNIVIHVKEVNRASIDAAIRRFREIGETDWRAAAPVSRTELPFESENAAFKRIKYDCPSSESVEGCWHDTK